MTSNELNWLKDTIRFIDQYRGSEDVRELVNSTYRYNNNSVFFYINNLIRFSSHYYDYYNKTFAKSLSYVSDKRTRAIIRDLPDKIELFLDRCIRDSQEYNRLINTSLGQISPPSYYSAEELAMLSAMDQNPAGIKPDLFDGFLKNLGKSQDYGAGVATVPVATATKEELAITAEEINTELLKYQQATGKEVKFMPKIHLSQEEEQAKQKLEELLGAKPQPIPISTLYIPQQQKQPEPQTQVPQAPQIRLQKPQIPSAIQDILTKGEIGTKRLETKALQGLGNMARTTGRSLLQGGGKLTTRAVGAAIQAGIRGLVALGASTGGTGWVILAAVLIVVGLLIILPNFMNLEETTSTLNPGQMISTNTSYSGDISQCKFSRAGTQYQIKSSRLRDLISEVSAKTGVPAAVIAGVAMHESPDFTANAQNDHDAFFNKGFTGVGCQPHFGLKDTGASSTGALGLMQVQPPARILSTARQDAYDERGVKIGAEFVGKTLESLTLNDFCDVRTSLYLGVGVLIDKNGGVPPTTADSVAKAVCGYFGSPCTYQSDFNYGQDVKNDFLACQAATLASTPGSSTTPPICSPSTTTTTPTPACVQASYYYCPVDNATIACGSAKEIINGCGHCATGYPISSYNAYCGWKGTKYAVDVAGNDLQQVKLPTVHGLVVQWSHVYQSVPAGNEQIQGYSGTDTDGNKWYIQFHHTQPDSGVSGSLTSGQVGARICDNGCGKRHVHVQLAIGAALADGSNWQYATDYIKCP